MKRKITALMLTAALLLGLLGGCMEPVDPAEVAAGMLEALEQQTQLSYHAEGELIVTLSDEKEISDVTLGVEADGRFQEDPYAEYVDTQISVSAEDNEEARTEKIGLTAYMTEGEDGYLQFFYSELTGTWDREEMEQGPRFPLKVDDLDPAGVILMAEKQMVDEKSCCMIKAITDDLYGLGIRANVQYYVDLETKLPVQVDVLVLDTAELSTAAMDYLTSVPLLGWSLSSSGFSLKVKEIRLSMTDIEYENVTVPPVPQDAYDETEPNPVWEWITGLWE